MLPKIARLKPGLTRRSRWSLLLCGLTVLALPTWCQQAQSQIQGNRGPTPPAEKSSVNPGYPGGKAGAATSPQADPPTAPRRPALPPMAPPSIEYLPEPLEAEKRSREILDEQADLDFTDETLTGVVEYLSARHKVNFVIGKTSLEDEGIAIDARDITLKLSGISLRSALKLLLEPKRMTFIIDDEVIKLVTQSLATEKLLTRTYPVRDLVGNVDADYKLLMTAVQKGVPAHDGWADEGGSECSISMLPATGCLVIRHSIEGHDEVLKLLRALRAANGESQVR